MKTNVQRYVILCVVLALNVWGMVQYGYAELAVELVADPDIQVIPLELGVKKIFVNSRTNKGDVQFVWKLTGPGTLEGRTTDAGIVYIPPDTLDTKKSQVRITVSVNDHEGETATKSVLFTLVSPTSNVAPPSQEPTPTPTPVTIRKISCPSENRPLENIQKTLPEHLKKYTLLKDEEQLGIDRQTEILSELQAIVCDLKAIEQILDQKYQKTPMPEIQERIQKTQNTRAKYEKEYRDRQKQ